MTSPFFGIDIAKRALQVDQTLVNIAGQNIANANTPGFSRQTADLQATLAYPIPVFASSGQPGQLGTGVEITRITRARDTFVDGQVRQQLTSQGRWDARKAALANVESVLNEPSTTGIASLMTKYFSAWNDVSNNPSDPSARASLIQQSQALASGFNTAVEQLNQQQRDIDQQVGQTVTNINTYATQIAAINRQVAMIESSGMHANDLRDQRDQLVDKLASLVKISTVENPDGEVSIYAGNRQLVDRNSTNQLQTVVPPGQSFMQLQWADGTSFTAGDGQLQGEIESRDQLLASEIQGVNATASRIIQSVNALHESGVDLNGHPGVAFFSGTDATNMAVSAALTGAGGTDAVAAARTYADTSSGSTVYTFARGDSSNALAIAELANSTASLDSTSGLGQTSNVAGPPAMLVNGISLTGAAAGTTYTFGWDSGTNTLQLSAAPGGSTADVTATIVPNGSSQLATIDALGVRLAVSVPNSATLSQALSAFVGQSVTTTGSPATIGNQYAEFVASVGVDSSTAQAQSQNQSVLVNQLAQQRESTSGVSLDEEATNLLQYQRAYEAAARVVTINDAMLDTLINHTGAM